MSKLFIICGHGDGDPGAIGNGYQEQERVRTLAQKIKSLGGDNVIIGDTSKNWYKSQLVNNNNIPKGSKVLELHTDSSDVETAKGAHVIIKKGFTADKYDIALADFLSSIFLGRSEKIVGRSDLANCNRAANAGINYRLGECGFISNADDVQIFNSKMDEIAKGILKCFDIQEYKEPVKKRTVEDVARDVMAGKYGEGHAVRKPKIEAEGLNYEEVRTIVNKLSGVSKVNYYPKYNGNSDSIVAALNSLGITSNFNYRKMIAKANGIKPYSGTASQNIRLLNLLKKGTLKKV